MTDDPWYYPGPDKPKNAWEAREAEGMRMDPRTMTLRRADELREERRWEAREAEGMRMDPRTMTLRRADELREERRWEVPTKSPQPKPKGRPFASLKAILASPEKQENPENPEKH